MEVFDHRDSPSIVPVIPSGRSVHNGFRRGRGRALAVCLQLPRDLQATVPPSSATASMTDISDFTSHLRGRRPGSLLPGQKGKRLCHKPLVRSKSLRDSRLSRPRPCNQQASAVLRRDDGRSARSALVRHSPPSVRCPHESFRAGRRRFRVPGPGRVGVFADSGLRSNSFSSFKARAASTTR